MENVDKIRSYDEILLDPRLRSVGSVTVGQIKTLQGSQKQHLLLDPF